MRLRFALPAPALPRFPPGNLADAGEEKGQGRDTSPAKSHYTHFIDCQLIIYEVILPVRFLITGLGERLKIYCPDSQYFITKSTLQFKDARLFREASG